VAHPVPAFRVLQDQPEAERHALSDPLRRLLERLENESQG
jgi:hypothetical protein